MSTSLKTTPPSSERTGLRRTRVLAAVGAAAALGGALVTLPAASAAPALHCSVQVPASAQVGAPVLLRLTLSNTGKQPLHLLGWNTPFEGAWFGASVQLWHQGRELPYQGPRVKRGAPSASDYLALAPGRPREASLDLGLVFDLSQPGRYELRPQFSLHDVQSGRRAVPRASQQALPLDCPTVAFTLSAKR